jgi:hypothetical protein
MPAKDLSQDEKPASTQPATPTAPSEQTPASVFSIKLISERSSITTPVRHDFPEQDFGGYGHYGLNE